MKKILFMVALCAPVWGWGQWVNGIDISKETAFDYIEIQGLDMAKMDMKKPMEYQPKIIVSVDFGQETRKDLVVKDSTGNQIFFYLDDRRGKYVF